MVLKKLILLLIKRLLQNEFINNQWIINQFSEIIDVNNFCLRKNSSIKINILILQILHILSIKDYFSIIS